MIPWFDIAKIRKKKASIADLAIGPHRELGERIVESDWIFFAKLPDRRMLGEVAVVLHLSAALKAMRNERRYKAEIANGGKSKYLIHLMAKSHKEIAKIVLRREELSSIENKGQYSGDLTERIKIWHGGEFCAANWSPTAQLPMRTDRYKGQ
jgi:hypothetical protein